MTKLAPPRAMRHEPLPPPPPRPAGSHAMIQALLDQAPPDPAWLAEFSTPEAVAERAAREAAERADDWPGLARYRAANAAVVAPDLVMIGDSLTEIWDLADPELFGARIVNRGIAGQTSPQLLARFVPDVVELQPMVDIAAANGISVLLASIPPAAAIFWQADARPQEFVPCLNAWLRDFAAARGARYLDYHAELTDGRGALQPRYSADGVHVTRAAYGVMRRVLDEAAQLLLD